MRTRADGSPDAVIEERWVHWPVYWSAIWIGALSALAAALIFGLIGIAVGAHLVGPAGRVTYWHGFGLLSLVFSVLGAFLAFVIGGWVTSRIAGILRSEPAMLHGAVTWLVTIPAILLFAALGAGSFFGSWHGGLAGSTSGSTFVAFDPPAPDTTDDKAKQLYAEQKETDVTGKDPNGVYQKYMAAKVTRNTALGAVTALLLGLIGAVIGGWMASGEPMNFTHYRTRQSVNGRTAAESRGAAMESTSRK